MSIHYTKKSSISHSTWLLMKITIVTSIRMRIYYSLNCMLGFSPWSVKGVKCTTITCLNEDILLRDIYINIYKRKRISC